MFDFYVYVYLDPRKPGKYIYGEYEFDYEPFYVGKGKGLRMYMHLSCNDRNKYKTNKIRSIFLNGLEPIIIKYREELDENAAYNLEVLMIDIIGYNKLGPLTNLTKGGLGGDTGRNGEDEIRKFNSDWHKKNWLELKNNNPERFLEIVNQIKKTKKIRIDAGIIKPSFLNKKHSKITKEKIGKTNSVKQKGEKNSQFGSCWIMKDGENKKIKKELFETYSKEGWVKGRKCN
jgi:hypothetical protein